MLDHIYLPVTDLARSKEFYTRTLGDLGWRVIGAYDSTLAPESVPDLFGFKGPNGSSIWLQVFESVNQNFYVGISAPSRADVDSAYAIAIDCGATDVGGPAIRHYFYDKYYAANVLDPDGHTLELVNKG